MIAYKSINHFLFIAIAILAFSLNIENVSGQTYAAKRGEILVTGTADSHSWALETQTVNCSADVVFSKDKLLNLSSLTFTIQVKDLKGRNIFMNRPVYKALKGYPFDKIRYYGVYFSASSIGENEYLIKTEGNLEIAGIFKITSILVNASVNSDGSITCTGSKAIKMSDFNVQLPKSERKRMNIGDEVILTYSIKLLKNSL